MQRTITSTGLARGGLLAQFRNQTDLISAADKLRENGYGHLEAFSPFPIHGIDEALGIGRSRLPWLVLMAGIVGGVSALGFQWWTNTIDYPFVVSGKPLFSLPANIPVTFEVVILSAAFAAFFGMLAFNRLPKLANPLFRSESFLRATNDGFFLFIDAKDALFEDESTRSVLKSLNACRVESIDEGNESASIPSGFVMGAVVLASLALIPPAVIASVRSTTSDKPRLHNFFDMDFQPKFKSQTASSLFTDGSASRPRVVGTVARGQIENDPEFYFGTNGIAGSDQTVTEQQAATNSQWVDQIPLAVTTELMDRGRERFNIHCAVCHGKAGYGNGLASQRALELEQGTWVPPTSIHAAYVRDLPDGQIYHTITNGVRKMPAYGHQIPPEDRWAIVLYIRALQRSQNASIQDVPVEMQSTLRETN